MLVRELVETLDPSLAVEIYALKEGNGYESLGLFRLDAPESSSALMEGFGERAVRRYDTYKAYTLIYLDE